MRPFLLSGFLIYSMIGVCQKPLIDTSVFGKWPLLQMPGISPNGDYVAFNIYNEPVGSNTMVLRSVGNEWEMKFKSVSLSWPGIFTSDSHIAFFLSRPDSIGDSNLGMVTLGGSVRYIEHVISYKIPENGTGEWLTYLINDSVHTMVLKNLQKGDEFHFPSIRSYQFSASGKSLLLLSELKEGGQVAQSVGVLDLGTQKVADIWRGKEADNFLFDADESQIVFMTTGKKDTSTLHAIMCYNMASGKTVVLADDHSPFVAPNVISNIDRFSPDGKYLLFFASVPVNSNGGPAAARFHLWSYTDAKLQSQQQMELGNVKSHCFSIDISNRRGVSLEKDDQESVSSFPKNNTKYCLIISSGQGDGRNEWNWNKLAQASVVLVNIETGTRQSLGEKLPLSIAETYRLSPDGKYVVFFDPFKRGYYSYTMSTGTFTDISAGSSGAWTSEYRSDEPDSIYLPIGIAGWLRGDSAVLVYDRRNIFELQLGGIRHTMNLTHRTKNNTDNIYRLALAQPYSNDLPVFGSRDSVVLSVFNTRTKCDGFYAFQLGRSNGPRLLTMSAAIFKGPDQGDNVEIVAPIKARDKNMFIVREMNASKSPNYYATVDFKYFKSLSDVYPERAYNWLTSELMTWKSPDGEILQGILYKPENFDSTKKYPVIISYYERVSETLNMYITPDACSGPINIPYFVSNGYLIFTPDIHYVVGRPGESALHSIASAYGYLSTFSWVNKARIGIQGHSFGGFETNYIIAHCNLFRAAMSSSGMSDFISCYGSILGQDGSSRQHQYELFRDRIGYDIWDRPDLYLDNSPVLRADKINTPLLMMNNDGDKDVPFTQGIELFTALRRLGKKAWMIQYSGEGHMVFDRSALDLTIRMRQFFDYYLMDLPPPKWMTKGIASSIDGADQEYDMDKDHALQNGLLIDNIVPGINR
jgi:dipeptidyl aminopeptidase/acylaminoacyl peptidase